ncbi:hypothetical protein GCM10027076_32400 [Nocardioides montaniterrae]
MTSAWTDVHTPLLTTVLVTSSLIWVAATQQSLPAYVFIALVLLVLLVATLTDAFGGIVAGLAAAAVMVGLDRLFPHVHAETFAAVAACVGLLMLLGVAAGTTTENIRRGRRRIAREAVEKVLPAEGSLGLLDHDDAALRLEEEMARAELHDRPLATALVHVDFTEDMDAEDMRRARRAVARVMEAELRTTDIPFVTEHDEIGVILPESSMDAAADVLESVLMLAREVTFNDRTTGVRRHVGDVATVYVGITDLTDDEALSPETMLDATRVDRVALAWSEA